MDYWVQRFERLIGMRCLSTARTQRQTMVVDNKSKRVVATHSGKQSEAYRSNQQTRELNQLIGRL